MELRTVRQYVSAARTDPRLRRTTHHYIADMLDYYTPETVFAGIHGMAKPIGDIVGFFRAHSLAMERRLLLLVGPQGSGKSTTVDKIKRHLERYSETEAGLAFAVEGCPFHQHPFDLVPADELDAEGFYWHEEAVPCPICDRLIQRHGGWANVPIQRMFLSARHKTGVAKHTPTDLRREDITTFVGNINFAMLKERGSTYDPQAYDFEGKIIWANRGILDWTEVFKSRRQLLSLLLELIQSKRIDLANFPTVHVDCVVIGHTNYPEYNVFLSEDIMEPLRGRIHKVDFPYNTDLEGETRIAADLVARGNRMRREEKHVPPDVFALTARYALKTRQESLGMRGLSPRFFEDAMSIAYTRAGACLDLEVVTNAIEEAFDHQSIKDLDVKDLLRQFEETKLEFLNDRISTLIDHLIPSQFFDYGQNVYRNYLDAIARCQVADAPAEEDRELIDEVENVLVERRVVSRPARAAFQNVLLARRDEMQAMSYTEHEHLRAAINEVVFSRLKACLRLYERTEDLDPASRELIDRLTGAAVRSAGYCPVCARSLFRFIGRSV